jgi:hypothetical protein
MSPALRRSLPGRRAGLRVPNCSMKRVFMAHSVIEAVLVPGTTRADGPRERRAECEVQRPGTGSGSRNVTECHTLGEFVLAVGPGQWAVEVASGEWMKNGRCTRVDKCSKTTREVSFSLTFRVADRGLETAWLESKVVSCEADRTRHDVLFRAQETS